jgi:hypothetical protein
LHKNEREAEPVKTPSSPSTSAGQNTAAKADKEKETGYLDIPAFLRRQAD